jgi:hypothetical protein
MAVTVSDALGTLPLNVGVVHKFALSENWFDTGVQWLACRAAVPCLEGVRTGWWVLGEAGSVSQSCM